MASEVAKLPGKLFDPLPAPPSVDVLIALRRLLDAVELRHLVGKGPCLGCGADVLLAQQCLEECPVQGARVAMGEKPRRGSPT